MARLLLTATTALNDALRRFIVRLLAGKAVLGKQEPPERDPRAELGSILPSSPIPR